MKNILVVDDSAFMRKIITDIIEKDKELNVIDTARNGIEAIDKLENLNVDLVTLDIEMPILNGIETLKKIKDKHKNLPVLMVSNLTKQGAELTLKALEIGAVDFITKPNNIFKVNSEEKSKEIVNKIKAIIYSKPNINIKLNKKNVCCQQNNVYKYNKVKNIVGIGCSTGGPRALQEIISQINSNINAAILIVQHMPKGFTKSLADRLNNISNICVKEAENGEYLQNGYCYIAPGDKHLVVINSNDKIEIRLKDGGPVSGHKPSVDKLISSIADLKDIKKIGVMLTGMGSDGAKGFKKLSESGSYNIGQNEETCIVYGMPKSAYKIGAIDIELPLHNIVNEIEKKLEG